MANASTFYTGRSAAPTMGFWASFRQAMADRAAYRRTHDELSQLTDRELIDLGFTRHDINRVARQAVYGV